MTTTDLLAKYEAAQDVLGVMIAALARKIRDEQIKKHPDKNLITALKDEQNKIADQEDALLISDVDGIELVLNIGKLNAKCRAYDEGKLTLVEASKSLNMSLEAFMDELGLRGITVVRYPGDELKGEVKAFLLNKSQAHIRSDSEILGGTLTVSGTRVPLANVLAAVDAGTSNAEIFRHYPSLPLDAIEVCIEYRNGIPPPGKYIETYIKRLAKEHHITQVKSNSTDEIIEDLLVAFKREKIMTKSGLVYLRRQYTREKSNHDYQ